MKTVCIQIGNSDDGLSQREWHDFVKQVQEEVTRYCDEVHFSAASEGSMPWQNYCWVFSIDESTIGLLRFWLDHTKQVYNQDSIAWLEGETEFI